MTTTAPEVTRDPALGEGSERFAHYTLKDKLGDSVVFGIPVEALCGKLWVPSRDPERYPVCPECKELYDMGPEGRLAHFSRLDR